MEKLKNKNYIIKTVLIFLIISIILVFPSCSANAIEEEAIEVETEEIVITDKDTQEDNNEENIDMEEKTNEEKIEEAIIKNIEVKEVEALIEDDNYFLLDVRTEEEYNSGYIKGAVNIPVSNLENELGKVPRDKKIIAYCKLGSRSRRAAKILIDNGHKEVYNMVGGIEEWKEEGLELEN